MARKPVVIQPRMPVGPQGPKGEKGEPAPMDVEFFVDALGGSDSNSGAQQFPFLTINKAISSVPIGGVGRIVLSDGQEHVVYGDVDIVNKYIKITRSGGGTTKPTIKFPSSLVDMFYVCPQIRCHGSCAIYIDSVDINHEPRANYDYGYNPLAATAFTLGTVGQLAIKIFNSNVITGGAGLATVTSGILSISFSSCNISCDDGFVLHIIGGVGGLSSSFDTTISDSSRWVTGVRRSTRSGDPINLMSNMYFGAGI